MRAPADWQLPDGVSRAVWDYAHDSTAATGYDAALAGTPLLAADLVFVREHLGTAPRIIFDLGCGTGRVAIPLAEAGHHVVGIDLAEPMLQVAREKAAAANVNLTLACGNLADLSAFREGVAEVAMCLFSTLGMIAGREARQRALFEANRLLRPGGMLLLHAHHLGHHWTTRAGRRMLVHDFGKRLLRRADAGDFVMPPAGGLPGWTMHLFTRGELVNMLSAAGFVIQECRAIDVAGRKVGAFAAYGFLVAAEKRGDPPYVAIS